MDVLDSTLDEIKRRREKLGLTQGELAKLAGVSQPLIARLESRKSRIDPTLSTFLKIKRALDETERRKVTAKGIYHSPIISISQNDTLEKAVKIMEKHGISQLPVIDDGFQIGSVSEGAIVRAISTRDIKKDTAVKEIIEEPLPMISPITDIGILSHLLENHAAVIVQEKGKPVGIITKHDVIGLLSTKRGNI